MLILAVSSLCKGQERPTHVLVHTHMCTCTHITHILTHINSILVSQEIFFKNIYLGVLLGLYILNAIKK